MATCICVLRFSISHAAAAAGCWHARIQAPAAFLRERLRRLSRDIAAQPVQRVSIWDGVQGSFDSGENDQAPPCRFQGTNAPNAARRGSGSAQRVTTELTRNWTEVVDALSRDFRRPPSHTSRMGLVALAASTQRFRRHGTSLLLRRRLVANVACTGGPEAHSLSPERRAGPEVLPGLARPGPAKSFAWVRRGGGAPERPRATLNLTINNLTINK